MLDMVVGTSSAAPLGNRHLALLAAEEEQRTEVIACRARPVEKVTLQASQPALAAEKQIAVERTAFDGLELCLAPWYLAESSYAMAAEEGLPAEAVPAEEILVGVPQLC